MKDLITPTEFGPCEQLVKKSRFIAFIAHAPDRETALAYVQAKRDAYPDARHVCWAFVAGEPGNTTDVGCSDDGEPSGTAGKPMLNVLLQGEVSEVVAVVVRYFGGIKLGAGGLLRAYSGAVADAMKQTPVVRRVACVPFQAQLDYALEDRVRRVLQHHGANLLQADYADQISLDCEVAATALAAVQAALIEVCAGQILLKLPEHP